MCYYSNFPSLCQVNSRPKASSRPVSHRAASRGRSSWSPSARAAARGRTPTSCGAPPYRNSSRPPPAGASLSNRMAAVIPSPSGRHRHTVLPAQPGGELLPSFPGRDGQLPHPGAEKLRRPDHVPVHPPPPEGHRTPLRRDTLPEQDRKGQLTGVEPEKTAAGPPAADPGPPAVPVGELRGASTRTIPCRPSRRAAARTRPLSRSRPAEGHLQQRQAVPLRPSGAARSAGIVCDGSQQSPSPLQGEYALLGNHIPASRGWNADPTAEKPGAACSAAPGLVFSLTTYSLSVRWPPGPDNRDTRSPPQQIPPEQPGKSSEPMQLPSQPQ